jgi:hypothetical protein
VFDYRLPALSHSRLAHELTREDWQVVQAGDLIAFRDADRAILPPTKSLWLRAVETDKDGNIWEICEVFAIPQRREQ